MAKKVILRCPKCTLAARVEIKKFCKFVIYKCPECQSNVAYYANKVNVISDDMVDSLKKKKRLTICGNALFPTGSSKKKRGQEITKDKITNLKILLETETDFDKLLSQL